MAKILIAEDEPDIRDLLSFTLQYGGFEVIAVPNGIEAIERAGKDKPDLIMLDVRMPKMTGYDACKALKSNPETSAIPVVFLSAKGQEAEVKAGLEAGALDYILKPFAPDLLLKRVRELLDRKKDEGKASPPESGSAPKGAS